METTTINYTFSHILLMTDKFGKKERKNNKARLVLVDIP